MASSTSPAFQKTFALDSKILGPGSSLGLQVGGATDADVIQAIEKNKVFPTRPSGVIDLSHISLVASGNNPVVFAGGETTVGFSFSVGVTAGLGVFDDPQAAIQSLDLGETPGLDLSMGAPANSRYMLLRAGYQASGSVKVTHPIGVFGGFTFGASAAADGISAVLHRFDAAAGADTVLGDTVSSWKFPRHIESASALEPFTWIVIEADGSLSAKLGTSLGYNFNFVKDAQSFGLAGDIGLKIDAAATATFGFDVSGRYVVVVGRESDDTELRLRLFKLKSNGMQFGLNLKLGVTGVETLTPNSVDDFVSAVFGVHGAQIIGALKQLEKWTDPSTSVGQLVAGLVNDKALALIQDTTGIDPKAAFEAARGKLLNEIQLYQGLPGKVSSELLGFINKLDPQASKEFLDGLTLLASTDQTTQTSALESLLSDVGVSGSPIGKILDALASNGLLSLVNELSQVRSVANDVLSIINGGVLAKLQSYINDKLHLNQIFNVVDQASFDNLDSFLVGRLSNFFDKTLHFEDLNTIKNAISMVISKRHEIYEKAVTALNSRYGLDLAAVWASTSSSTAVVDAVFDMNDGNAQQLFSDLVAVSNSALDRLVRQQVSGIQIKTAVLSHELQRKGTLEISLPHFNFQSQNVTTALANVHPQDDGGRILLFDASGTSTIAVANRFVSSLSITVAAAIARTGAAASLPDLRIHSRDGATWSYQLLYTKAGMKREELEAITRPFIAQFMASQFAQGTSLSTFYNQLEDTANKILNNGPETFGDTCAAFEVVLPGETIGAWTLPLTNVPATARAMSVAIQSSIKEKLPFFYLNDISQLANLASAAPLLAWAAIPSATAFDGTTFNSNQGKNVFWDHMDVTLRKAAATHPSTQSNLLAKLAGYRLRLEEAGLHTFVQFYQDDQVGKILTTAIAPMPGDVLLSSLLTFESQIINKADDALNDVQRFLAAAAGGSPSQAVARLARFAADIVTAFNQLVGQSVFASLASFRAIGQTVFAEASRAINPALGGQPKAMLTVSVLNVGHTSDLPAFLNGTPPPSGDIAVAQRLVTF
jgi:hypothetical protein